MALVNCPECGKEISERAILCPHCGVPRGGLLFGFEYHRRTKLFGLPLVHIVLGPGINTMTGRPRVAKGIIAIGGVAVGVVAFGGLVLGGITFL